MSILSDSAILAAREAGDIVIDPFERRNLGTDTYDVRLGQFFYRENHNDMMNPFSKLSVGQAWRLEEPGLARGYSLGVEKGWKDTDLVIFLFPGETLLAHTLEFIGARRKYTTRMHARSSIGRSMIGVCKCAGRGDCGFFNRWTMEITSFAQHHIIPLKVGMRIAQIEFIDVGQTERVYGETHGKYQASADLETVKRSWRAEMMLPRLYDDWETPKEAESEE